MRKTRILFASLLTTSLVPVFVASACAKKEEAIPESITLTYGDGLTDDITIDENGTLEFKTQVFPENAKQDAVIESENQSVAIIEGNKLIPKGVGTTRIFAYPVGYQGLKAQINVTIAETTDITKIDESNVVNDGRLIGGLSGTYGIMLTNFKADFLISDDAAWKIGSHTLTAKIDWVSDESMEDDAAGITSIKTDNFNNSTFSAVCSFKPTGAIAVGHVFKFKLIFYVDYDFASGSAAATIHGTKEYSITYDGDNDYEIDDSGVQKNIVFNGDDCKLAIITGYKAPFYFGEDRPFQLEANAESLGDVGDVLGVEFMNKSEVDGYTTFDLGIRFREPAFVFENVANKTIYFTLNGIDVLISTGYTVLKTEAIEIGVDGTQSIKKDGGKSKLLIEGLKSNFDFSAEELRVALSMSGTGYPDPTSYNIIFVTDKKFNVEFYWDTLLGEFEFKIGKISFFHNGGHLVNSDKYISLSNLDDEYFIRFNGDHIFKVDLDPQTNKYFARVIRFDYGPGIDIGESWENITFKLNDQSGTEIPTSFYPQDYSVYDETLTNSFCLLMVWDVKPENPSDVYLDVTYDGTKKINALQLSLIDPDPSNFYSVTASSNVGSIDILKNNQNQTIDLGIKVNLAEYELMGLDFSIIGSLYSGVYSAFYSYEYNSDQSSPYKILVHIKSRYSDDESPEFSITACDIITLNAIFAPNGTPVITLSQDGTASVEGISMMLFQTAAPVTINPNTTYYIKAPISNWTALQAIKDELEGLDAVYFVCGEDLSSDSTHMSVTGQFYSFCNKYVLANANYSPFGLNHVYIGFGWKEIFDGSIWTSEITLIWTPEIASPVTINLGICTPSIY